MIEILFWSLCLAVALLYIVGGEGALWYRNRKVRIIGCPICLACALGIGAGWNWWLVAACVGVLGAITLSDFGKWFWTVPFFVGCLALIPYAWPNHLLSLAICIVVGTPLTYIVSRWCQTIDPALRGTVFALIPVVFRFIK